MERRKECNKASEPQLERNHIEDLSSVFLNVQQIAKYLGTKPSTVYSLVEEKKIPHYRIGRQIRFKKSDVDEWMEKQREEVVDVKVEDRRVIGSLQKRSDPRIKRVVKKIIEEAKGERYTVCNGKPNQDKGLGKEVSHGAL